MAPEPTPPSEGSTGSAPICPAGRVGTGCGFPSLPQFTFKTTTHTTDNPRGTTSTFTGPAPSLTSDELGITSPQTSTSSALDTSSFETANSTATTDITSSSTSVRTSGYSSINSTSNTLVPTVSSSVITTNTNSGPNAYTTISIPQPPTPSSSLHTMTESSTSSIQTSASARSNTTASGATLPSSSTHSTHTGAIVGGIIGGLAFLLLTIVATILLRRRMRARRTAPSAEFMNLARGTTPGLGAGAVRMKGTMTPSGDRLLSLARQRSLGDDVDRPPAFTPGTYADPVLEKVQVATAMREQYRPRDSYAAAQAGWEGTSEMGYEGESTQVGTEEGYGSGGDEKSGYYTWAM